MDYDTHIQAYHKHKWDSIKARPSRSILAFLRLARELDQIDREEREFAAEFGLEYEA